MKALPRSFYLRPAFHVARDLLGKHLIRRSGNSLLIGRIVETEAYRNDDPASHSFHGRTKRNEMMFQEGGHLYVYFTYGMHFCANIVTGIRDMGEAVLIRGVEPLVGIQVMLENRFSGSRTKYSNPCTVKNLLNLTNGPAKFCSAFNITQQHNGIDLLGNTIWITEPSAVKSSTRTSHRRSDTNWKIGRSSRIGIRVGLEKKWRFFIKGNLWVSGKNNALTRYEGRKSS